MKFGVHSPRQASQRLWAWLAAALVLVIAACLGLAVARELRRLPGAAELRDTVYARRDAGTQSTWMPLWAMAGTLQVAVVTWEDPAFYHHGPLNYPAIARAAWLNLRAGRYAHGGSSITQQVVKNQFLGREKTLLRKLREALLAHRLERVLTKDEILTVYLNIAEWGDGVAGAEAASHLYFGKPAAALDWSEAALLAGILPNPRDLNPCADRVRARAARNAVLAKLLEHGHLSRAEFDAADGAAVPACGR